MPIPFWRLAFSVLCRGKGGLPSPLPCRGLVAAVAATATTAIIIAATAAAIIVIAAAAPDQNDCKDDDNPPVAVFAPRIARSIHNLIPPNQ